MRYEIILHRHFKNFRLPVSVSPQLFGNFFSSLALGRGIEEWHKDNDPEIFKLVSFISVWINKDQISENVRKFARHGLEEQGVRLPAFFLMKQHALFCCSIRYWLNLSLQEFVISLANAYDSILSGAHLYNAARQSRLLNSTWPDMEYLISVHTTQRIFVGGQPTKPEDFYKRFQTVFGARVQNFARNRRTTRPKAVIKRCRKPETPENMPIHDTFRGRYCSVETRAEFTDSKLQVIIAEAVTRHPEMDHIAKIASQWAKTRRLTSLQLLSILGVAVVDDDLHSSF
jgi:hypothetical protein